MKCDRYIAVIMLINNKPLRLVTLVFTVGFQVNQSGFKAGQAMQTQEFQRTILKPAHLVQYMSVCTKLLRHILFTVKRDLCVYQSVTTISGDQLISG